MTVHRGGDLRMDTSPLHVIYMETGKLYIRSMWSEHIIDKPCFESFTRHKLSTEWMPTIIYIQPRCLCTDIPSTLIPRGRKLVDAVRRALRYNWAFPPHNVFSKGLRTLMRPSSIFRTTSHEESIIYSELAAFELLQYLTFWASVASIRKWPFYNYIRSTSRLSSPPPVTKVIP